MASDAETLYDHVGGAAYFETLVDRFYDAVSADPVLRPMYPDDLSESKRTLTGFLIQYWGGPADYSAERGHPRLRMRHVPFAIGQPERDAWARHMGDAVRASGASEAAEAALLSYFDQAATAMINTAPGA